MNIHFQSQLLVLSSEAKDAAVEIEHRLQLGSKLSDVVNNKEDAHALFSLYEDEGYILTEHGGKFCVISYLLVVSCHHIIFFFKFECFFPLLMFFYLKHLITL